MRDVVRALLYHRKALGEEVDFAFVVVHEEGDDVMRADQSQKLRALVRGQSDHVVVVLVDDLDGVEDLGVNIQVDQVGVREVAAIEVRQASLDLEPVLDADLVEQLEDQLEAALQVALGETAVAVLRGSDQVATLILVTLSIILRDLELDGVQYVLLHEILLDLLRVLSDNLLQLLLIIRRKHSRLSGDTAEGDLLLAGAILNLANDVLKLLRHIEQALQQVPQRQDTLVLSLLASKGNKNVMHEIYVRTYLFQMTAVLMFCCRTIASIA